MAERQMVQQQFAQTLVDIIHAGAGLNYLKPGGHIDCYKVCCDCVPLVGGTLADGSG